MTDRAQELIEEGRAARDSGKLDLALERHRAGAEILRCMVEPQRLAHTVRHVADIERQMERLDAAEVDYAEALAIYRDDAAKTGKLDLANTLRGYALLREERGDLKTASEMWSEARELYAALDLQVGVDEADRRLKKFGAV
jgi:tetratricopeptide (TPR) repeat protein